MYIYIKKDKRDKYIDILKFSCQMILTAICEIYIHYIPIYYLFIEFSDINSFLIEYIPFFSSISIV